MLLLTEFLATCYSHVMTYHLTSTVGNTASKSALLLALKDLFGTSTLPKDFHLLAPADAYRVIYKTLLGESKIDGGICKKNIELVANSEYPTLAKACLLKLLHGTGGLEKPSIDSILGSLKSTNPLGKLISELLPAEVYIKHSDAEVVQTLLNQPYIDKFGVLKYLYHYVMNCSVQTSFYTPRGTTAFYLAPVFALCQRTGSGKTKSVLELGRKYLPVLYVGCAGNAVSPGEAIDLFTRLKTMRQKSQDDKGEWAWGALKIIFSCAEYFYEHLVKSNYAKGQAFSEEILSTFAEQFFRPSMGSHDSTDLAWKRILEIEKGYGMDYEDIIEADHESNPFLKLRNLCGTQWKFVMMLDEARVMVPQTAEEESTHYSSFEIIRKVAGMYANNMHHLLVIIVADTSSTISNFTPPSMEFMRSASHLRRLPPLPSNLIPPFIQLSGFDTGAKIFLRKAHEAQSLWDLKTPTGPWKEFMKYRREHLIDFFMLGSPLWNSFCQYSSSKSLDDLFNYAAAKMNNGKYPSDNMTDTTIIAALSSLVALSIFPDSMLAQNLVAGGMAQLDYLNSDRHYGYISYPSDPSLAEGASIILKKTAQPLKTLVSNVEKSLIDVGMSGEVVARILMIAAMDRLRAAHPNGVYTVGQFLGCLLNEEFFMQLEVIFSTSDIWNAEMFFNHTVVFNRQMTRENAAFSFVRGAIATGYPQQTAWDVILSAALRDGHLGGLFLQIKNHSDTLSGSEVATVFSSMESANVLEGERNVRKRPKNIPLRHMYFLVNFQQGSALGTFSVSNDGKVEIQGDFSTVFQPPSDEPGALENLRELLRPRVSFHRMRLAENPPHSNKLYDFQDHARVRCVIEDPFD